VSLRPTTEDRLTSFEYLLRYLVKSDLEREEAVMHRTDNNHNTMVILMVLLMLALGVGIGALLMFMVIL
jgi:hypothetical protein